MRFQQFIFAEKNTMKKVMIYTLLVVAILLLLPLVVGLFIPRERTYAHAYNFASPVEKVFAAVTDVEGQPAWRADVKAIEILETTPNLKWREVLHKGPAITFQERRKLENRLFEIEIVESAFGGRWVGTFEPLSDGGTRVTFTETSIIANPFLRTVSILVIDLNKTISEYTSNLRKHLGES